MSKTKVCVQSLPCSQRNVEDVHGNRLQNTRKGSLVEGVFFFKQYSILHMSEKGMCAALAERSAVL